MLLVADACSRTTWSDSSATTTCNKHESTTRRASRRSLGADHLGAPTKLTRPNDNAIVWRWDRNPFGNGAPDEDPDGNSQVVQFNLRFPGQYFDSETGLNYNYFRDYDPATGRYVQSDPIGLEGGINTYAYAEGNPASYIDPRGLAVWKVLSVFEVGAVAGVGGQYVIYKLQSPCSSRGKRYTITVQAVGPSAGIGIDCKFCFTSPHKVPFDDGGFDDHGGDPDPQAFNGPFLSVSVGAQIGGIGGSYGDTVLGRATQLRSFNPTLGFGSGGAEIAGTIGTSTVTDVVTENCECEGK